MSKRNKVLLGGGGAALLVILVMVSASAKRDKGIEVRFETVGRRDLVAAVTASGKIEAKTSVDISADITGRIIKIAVREGDVVHKGQFLIQIDPAQYQAAGDATIQLAITGEPRPLSGQAAQVAYRTAQEGLTNARKHAPGQPVTLALAFEPGQVAVTVENPLPPDDQARPLAATGAGAGLTGLKERAALAGGTLEAGPADGTWRTALRIPA